MCVRVRANMDVQGNKKCEMRSRREGDCRGYSEGRVGEDGKIEGNMMSCHDEMKYA